MLLIMSADGVEELLVPCSSEIAMTRMPFWTTEIAVEMSTK